VTLSIRIELTPEKDFYTAGEELKARFVGWDLSRAIRVFYGYKCLEESYVTIHAGRSAVSDEASHRIYAIEESIEGPLSEFDRSLRVVLPEFPPSFELETPHARFSLKHVFYVRVVRKLALDLYVTKRILVRPREYPHGGRGEVRVEGDGLELRVNPATVRPGESLVVRLYSPKARGRYRVDFVTKAWVHGERLARRVDVKRIKVMDVYFSESYSSCTGSLIVPKSTHPDLEFSLMRLWSEIEVLKVKGIGRLSLKRRVLSARISILLSPEYFERLKPRETETYTICPFCMREVSPEFARCPLCGFKLK